MNEETIEYTTHPVVRKSTVKSRKLTKTQKKPPVLCKNKDELDDYMKHCVAGHRLRMFNNLKAYHNVCSGEASREGSKSFLTKPQYNILSALVPLIKYQNLVMVNKEEITKALGCHKNSVNKKLSIVSDFVRVETEGLKKGMYKLYINPTIGYKFESMWLDAKREQATKDWYAPKGQGVRLA